MTHWGLVVFATSAGRLASYCGAAATVGGALVGLIFRGAAAAWREERDAAVDKAERLERMLSEQAGQIRRLEAKVELLENRTDYEVYAERNGREHQQIVDELAALGRNVGANTTAIEFLIKQVFPTAVSPATWPAEPAA